MDTKKSKIKKTILYYTNNVLDGTELNKIVRRKIRLSGLDIVSVTQYPLGFGQNTTIDASYSTHSIIKQIITGLKQIKTGLVYFAEHDVLYDPSHWQLTPAGKLGYNVNCHQLGYNYWSLINPKNVLMSMMIGDCEYLLDYFLSLNPKSSILEPERVTGSHEKLKSKAPCIDVRSNFTINRLLPDGKAFKILKGYGDAVEYRAKYNITSNYIR